MKTLCSHLLNPDVAHLRPATQRVCPECVALGATWVHLRVCQTCGHVGCCDSSPNTHATKHFHATQHPVVASAEPGERWVLCYQDEEMAEY
ncbi:MAG: UBP-type zinc finger domain-containing protein [Janthinobacterium lividum]